MSYLLKQKGNLMKQKQRRLKEIQVSLNIAIANRDGETIAELRQEMEQHRGHEIQPKITQTFCIVAH